MEIESRGRADACLSPCTCHDRTCRVEMVRRGQGEYNREVLCATVEQEFVRLGSDTKHSEVQNLSA